MNVTISARTKRRWRIWVILAFAANAITAAKPLDEFHVPGDSIKSSGVPPRVYTASRLSTEKPLIDGDLSDTCWSINNWAGDFVQWIPSEGAAPSQPTEFMVLYDDDNIYVAIRAYDNEPSLIQRHAGRRDELLGDLAGISFDSYHDRRTAFEFDISAYGQKIDAVLTNPMNADFNWNAVWTGKVGMEDSAWMAEMEIPLSQLRYSSEDEQVWGLHCWRWIGRLQEESDWEPQSFTGPGILYLFGELNGISGLKKSRRFELMPYALGKLNTFDKQPANPFARNGRSWGRTLGADAKIGISSNFTVDLTINPDFGQVEADPSVMNLTAFETFYEEKRPFFLEGKNIFDYDMDDMILFYSRRIGHAPSYAPSLDSGEYSHMPENTSIIDALKLSGKTSGGFSLGILQSLTTSENAVISTGGDSRRKEKAEPYTNYMVGRMQQDFKQGNTVIGGIFTSTNRIIKEDQLAFLNRAAYTGGVDLLHQWKDKKYYVDAKFIGSYVNGDEKAITELQRSSTRYYQRPDADYLSFDTARTHLAGSAGSIHIGRKSQGLWRYSAGAGWFSPGLALNDIGYMQQTDIIRQSNEISYFVNRPVSVFRTYTVTFCEGNHWDFGGRYLVSDFELEARFEFLNRWVVEAHPGYQPQRLDTRMLRGGEAMLLPATWRIYSHFNTDYSKKLQFAVDFYTDRSNQRSTHTYEISPALVYRPVNAIRLRAGTTYTQNYNQLQYVETLNSGGQDRFILGTISQKTLSLVFRIDYIITPELSLQYYGSPFVSTGSYTELKHISNPVSDDYGSRFELYNHTAISGNRVFLDENNDAVADYSIQNPDFNFLQFRSNLVGRWEYRPGSVIYLVWSMDRTGGADPIDTSLGRSMLQLGDIHPNNIFLVKFNYWFSL